MCIKINVQCGILDHYLSELYFYEENLILHRYLHRYLS